MKITERRLRSIIRETLLEEQNRIDESAKDVITKGLLALIMTHGPSAVVNMANSIGETGHSISDPISGTAKQQPSHSMTLDEEAKLNDFLDNPTPEKVTTIYNLLDRVNISQGAGRTGVTPSFEGGYTTLIEKVKDQIDETMKEYPDHNFDRIVSL
jgi:hypothetical protein